MLARSVQGPLPSLQMKGSYRRGCLLEHLMLRPLLAATICVIALDQASKWFVLNSLSTGATSFPRSPFRLRRVLNPRRGFGRPAARAFLLLGWSLAAAGAAASIRHGLFFHGTWSQVGLGVALGGAASNLLDCFRHGAVVDFIDCGFWPVFNLADMGIVCGLALAFWNIA